MAASEIHNKLITDFATLQFSNGSTIFNSVRKFYAQGSMKELDCLIIPDTTDEIIDGNTSTRRSLGFVAIVVENIADSATNTEGSVKYERLLNIQDSILDYIEKEPSNLNAWGQSQSPVINIYKMRLRQVIFDQQETQGGIAEVMAVRFNVYFNLVPQNL